MEVSYHMRERNADLIRALSAFESKFEELTGAGAEVARDTMSV
jgi:hypothetical protein